MSQSLVSSDNTPTSEHRSRIKDFTKMLMAGRSFSGRESHSFFLNQGGDGLSGENKTRPQFANISAGSGLDLLDDGRAVGVLDVDQDGDQDFWVSNRNAPRLRLLRNDMPTQNESVSISLRGTGGSTNRDAIGARVEVVCAGDADRRRIKTLQAGHGFVSQSSKWLHFGLGAGGTEIEKVLVHWPTNDIAAGEAEVFTDIVVNGRFLLVQGSGVAKPVSRVVSTIPLASSPPEPPASSGAARVSAVTPIYAPSMSFTNQATGNPITVGGGRPVLVNFWASWCQPCNAELAELTKRAADLENAGIDVVALAVDGIEDLAGDIASVQSTISRLNFPHAAGLAPRDLVEAFQAHHDELVTTRTPMPVPTSFLINGEGRIAVMYKGTVSIEQLIADASRPIGNRAQRWLDSAQIPGRPIDHELVLETYGEMEADRLYQLAELAIRRRNRDQTIFYLEECLRNKPDFKKASDLLQRVKN